MVEVIDKRKKYSCCFKDIPIGDFFECVTPEDAPTVTDGIFIKIEDSKVHNALRINDTHILGFDNEDEVRPLDVQLIIK